MAFKSPISSSQLDGLFGGHRKNLFLTAHPLNGISQKSLGIKTGASFYDLDKQELEYKDDTYKITANCAKRSIELTKKLDSALSVTLGSGSNFSLGAGYTFGGDFKAEGNLKLLSNFDAELSGKATVAGANVAGDVSVAGQSVAGLFGVSYEVAGAHVGAVVQTPSNDFAVSAYASPTIPGTEKATLGVEVHPNSSAVILGSEVALSKDLSLVCKAGLDGVAQISAVQKLQGMKFRGAVEADLKNGTVGKFGAQLTIDK